MNNTMSIGCYRLIVHSHGYVLCNKWTDEFGILHTNEQEVEARHEQIDAMLNAVQGGDIEVIDNRTEVQS